MALNILVIGGGGREHAICWKLRQSPRTGQLWCVPGNPGIAQIAHGQDLPLRYPFTALIAWARERDIGLTVVGPEAPLSEGIVDAFQAAGLRIFGPTQAAAQLEASKAFAKDVMIAAGVPTAAHETFSSASEAEAYLRRVGAPVVVKADGLAAGKGVVVATQLQQALDAVQENLGDKRFGSSSDKVVIEEFLVGREVSIFALCDGKTALPFASAEDHKRLLDDDKGPNTGGMGAFAPSPLVDDAMMERVRLTALQPVVDEMARRGTPYVGILYAGLMVTGQDIKVLEYNCRFGDPETQVVLPLLNVDLVDFFEAAIDGRAGSLDLGASSDVAVGVVMAASGYPGIHEKGQPISGLETANARPGVVVFHAGTASGPGGSVISRGGRVLTVIARAQDYGAARGLAYAALGDIRYEGSQWRRDIGLRALDS